MSLCYEDLYQVLLKKDETIFSLQKQLKVYEIKFGPLQSTEEIEKSSDARKPDAFSAELSPNCRDETDSVDGTAIGDNVILDFQNDSPSFRRQLLDFEANMKELKAFLKEVASIMKEFVTEGMKLNEIESRFAQAITNSKYFRALFTTCHPEMGTISRFLDEFHDFVIQMQSSRTSMLLSMESLLHVAVEKFHNDEIRDVGELRKEFLKTADEYELQLGKLLSKSKSELHLMTDMNGFDSDHKINSNTTTDEDSMALGSVTPSLNSNSSASGNIDRNLPSNPTKLLENEMLQCRARFELARFDLVHYLNRIESQKKIFLFESFNSVLYAFFGHYNACKDLIRNIEPSVRQRQEQLQKAKKTFEIHESMWNNQRRKLEIHLSMHAVLRKSDDDTNSNSPKRSALPSQLFTHSNCNPSTATIPRIWSQGLKVPIQVISSETRSSQDLLNNGMVDAKEGYLFVRNSLFPSRSWKRKWFHIRSGKLYQNRHKYMDLILVCDLMLSKVRVCNSTQLPFCFEVLDANQNKIILQATCENEMKEWIVAAQRSTEIMLEKQTHRMTVHPKQQQYIQEIIKANPNCADCEQSPADWVSINIGCLLCIDCSGIHRSLGVHVSKIRSLSLDSWEISLLQFILEHLGNKVVNSIWEAYIPDGWVKPDQTVSSREEKTKWIKAKYNLHAFTEFSDLRHDELRMKFLNAVEKGNVQEILWCLAHGVDINCQNEKKKSAYQLCSNASVNYCREFLVLNGANEER